MSGLQWVSITNSTPQRDASKSPINGEWVHKQEGRLDTQPSQSDVIAKPNKRKNNPKCQDSQDNFSSKSQSRLLDVTSFKMNVQIYKNNRKNERKKEG